MKKLGLILFTLLLSTSLMFAEDEKKQAKIEFETTEYDFGEIDEDGGDVSTVFKIKNTGDTPLIIQRVKTTCGCTTPDYSRKPISPGEEGLIRIKYSPKYRPGTFSKNVRIYTNVTDTPYNLTIKGIVKRNEE